MNEVEVKERVGKKNWKRFLSFMRGQTYSISEDGKVDYYECDVDNFLHLQKTGRTIFYD